MEDTQVLKHHYIYSFRWDATNDKSTLDYMKTSFKELEISNWIGKHEVSEKGKPHFQMAVWTERKLLAKEMDKVRKRFIRSKLTSKTAQPVSFVSGRKIQSLIAYCQVSRKDHISRKIKSTYGCFSKTICRYTSRYNRCKGNCR